MNTPASSIACFLAASLLGALGQFFYKSGAQRSSGTLASYVFNAPLIGGVVCYIGVMVLFVAAFKRGGQLTVLYPVYATTFIWAALIAWWAYGIAVRPVHVLGMACLIFGMYLMGK